VRARDSISALMKALVQEAYGPIANLRLAEREKPAAADKMVVVRIRAAGVDPSIWHLMTGRPYLIRLMGLGFSKPKMPVAGWDGAGVVESVGSGVTRFKPGDEVFGSSGMTGTGTFAEFALLPEESCAPKPANLTLEEAAALPVSGCTALQAVRDVGTIAPDAQVLVIGAGGGVGHFAVQIAKAHRAKVTGLCGMSKLDFVRALGADDALDYARESLANGAQRWDVIIDTAGRRPLAELRRALSRTGRLAIVGGEGGNPWTGGFIERTLAASLLSLVSAQTLRGVTAKVTATNLLFLKELVEANKLRPVIDRRYPLDQAVEALKELEKGHARGKSVVVID